jgi:hypothetical protein
MSFKCEQCGLQVLPRVPKQQVVVQFKKEKDGLQIARAIGVCPTCAAKHQEMGGKIV